VIYSIFTKLREESLFEGQIPTSIPDAVNSLKSALLK
jgi:hypothetical protein